MLTFLHNTRTSMHTNRRTSPTALDFTSALALTPNTSTASLLKAQLKLSLPPDISTPDILDPEDPPPAAPDDFSSLLQPLVMSCTPKYIPSHFPRLPPQHAWKHTPVFPEREHDARRMRERATEEGILAEQALRKLAAAAKSGAVKAEKRRESNALSGQGRRRESNHDRQRKQRVGGGEDEGMFAAMLGEAGGGGGNDEAAALAMSLDGAADLREEGVDVGMPEGLVVNSEMGGWRQGIQKGRTHA